MKRWFKWAAWTWAVLVLLVVATAVLGHATGRAQARAPDSCDGSGRCLADRRGQRWQRGRYLFMSRGCTDCHGANGGGRDFINDGKGMPLPAPTSPAGGVVAPLPARGLGAHHPPRRQAGRPAGVGHAERGLQPLHRRRPRRPGGLSCAACRRRRAARPCWSSRAGEGAVRLWRRSTMRPRRSTTRCRPRQPVAEGVTAAHGAYVANMCIGCHGAGLSGGKIPGGPPDWPAAANLTPGEGSAMARYPDAAHSSPCCAAASAPTAPPLP